MTPAKMMMNTGLMDWTQAAGISQPKRLRSSFSCEYTAMNVNCCWNSAQNPADAMNKGNECDHALALHAGDLSGLRKIRNR
jgi:hypothetical protein